MAKAATAKRDDEGITSETRTAGVEPQTVPEGYLATKVSEVPYSADIWNPLAVDPHTQVLPPATVPPVDAGFVPQQVHAVRLAGAGDQEVPQVISPRAVDTPTYGTETPPRQTPPTNIDSPLDHSPPSNHSATGEPGAGVDPPGAAAPDLVSIAPSTAVAGGADLTMIAIGTGFDAGSVITFDGFDLATTYTSPTELSATVTPGAAVAGDVPVTVRSAAGESAPQTFSFTGAGTRKK
jgi:IPT/TIG domain